jgi:hypothetical protein
MEFVGRRAIGALEAEEVGRRGRLTAIVRPSVDRSVVPIAERLVSDEPAALDEVERCLGATDLRAAVCMVASRKATSVTLSGFPDGGELLRLGRRLSGEDVVVEPLIRHSGGGFDIRVRRAGSAEA